MQAPALKRVAKAVPNFPLYPQGTHSLGLESLFNSELKVEQVFETLLSYVISRMASDKEEMISLYLASDKYDITIF